MRVDPPFSVPDLQLSSLSERSLFLRRKRWFKKRLGGLFDGLTDGRVQRLDIVLRSIFEETILFLQLFIFFR